MLLKFTWVTMKFPQHSERLGVICENETGKNYFTVYLFNIILAAKGSGI